MGISFRTKEEFLTFHDPTQSGKLIERKIEVRWDPLTDQTSRIIYDPGAPFIVPEYEQEAYTSGKKCPFCTNNVMTVTPSFPEELIEDGRIEQGEAIAFPNLFPYCKHNAVVRMCNQHYVKLEQFTVEMIVNAFKAAHQYLQRVVKSDDKLAHASINWNYLPPSGGSILHPHLHVFASEQPTTYQMLVDQQCEAFYRQHGERYYDVLLREETIRKSRWVGQKDMLSWIHAFAPKSHCDFIGIFDKIISFEQIEDACWYALAESILAYFGYFQKMGLASFNLALMLPIHQTDYQLAHVRLVPRMTIGALGTSDMNVLNYMHGEALSMKVPEQVAKEAATFF